ncbi:hypothetical protein ABK040_000446 [Willaertia magna]
MSSSYIETNPLVNQRNKRYERYRQSNSSSGDLSNNNTNNNNQPSSIASQNLSTTIVITNTTTNTDNNTTSVDGKIITVNNEKLKKQNIASSSTSPSSSTEEEMTENDYKKNKSETPGSCTTEEDEAIIINTENSSNNIKRKKSIKKPKVPILLNIPDTNLIASNSLLVSSSCSNFNNSHNDLLSSRSIDKGFYTSRDESKPYPPIEDLIKKSSNKIGEEVKTTDKEYEMVVAINRAVERISRNSTFIPELSLSQQQQGFITKRENSIEAQYWKKINFEQEFSVDESFTFRDLGIEFRVFCPTVFQHLRYMFKVSELEFKRELTCETGPFTRIGSAGKSGAFFFCSDTSKFLLKSVTEEELTTVLELLPYYHRHVQKNPYTFLSNFYLLFEITTKQYRRVFIVMNNVFYTPLTIHRKYDLKGSTAGRIASESEKKKKSPILKDLDIGPGDIKLNLDLKLNFYRRIEKDIRFLQENDIMDYSLLLGVHSHKERTAEESQLLRRLKLPHKNDTQFNGIYKNCCSSSDGQEIYFFGIIDILQKFNSRKQVEKVVKSGMHSLKAKIVNRTKERVSVEKPFKYGQRFENFMKILCSTVNLEEFKPGSIKSYYQRLDISEEFYHKLIRLQPKDYKAFFYRGLLYHSKINDIVNAASDYTKSIKLNPQYINVNSYLFRALLYLTAANSILEKRGDEVRYIMYSTLAFKDLQKLIELYQHCADAYVLRGVLFQYKFKYHLLLGNSNYLNNNDFRNSSLSNHSSINSEHASVFSFSELSAKESRQFGGLLAKKNYALFSSIDLTSLSELLLTVSLSNNNHKNDPSYAIIQNAEALRKIIAFKTKERLRFYPRNGKTELSLRSESLVLNTSRYTSSSSPNKPLRVNDPYLSPNNNTTLRKNRSDSEIDNGHSVEIENKENTIKVLLDYVSNQNLQLYKLAENDFLKAIEINPTLVDPYKFQKMASKLELDWYNAYIQLGLLYLDLDRVEDAEKQFNESIKQSEKQSTMAFFCRGNIYANRFLNQEGGGGDISSSHFTMAISDYLKCTELDPSNYKAWHNMGYLYRINFPEKAENCYTQSITLNEEFVMAYYNRGLLYKNSLKNGDKAVLDFTKVIELDPSIPYSYVNRGIILLEMGEIFKAEKDLLCAIEYDSECSTAYYELAMLYLTHLNDEEKYKFYFNQFKVLTGKRTNSERNGFFEDFSNIVF